MNYRESIFIGPFGTLDNKFSEIWMKYNNLHLRKCKMAASLFRCQCVWNVKVGTKWPLFCRRHFKCISISLKSTLLFLSIRKSKDYVYGIWVYKALDIWKGYYRVKKSLVSYVKPWTEARNNKYMKYHSKLTYQLSFWNLSRKVDYHAGGKWFIHGPKRRKENQLLSLKHSCWLSLV